MKRSHTEGKVSEEKKTLKKGGSRSKSSSITIKKLDKWRS